jgi:hypothetical protein
MESDTRVRARQNMGERAEHAIYGTIIVLALIVAEDEAAAAVGVAIATVLGAALATALAELYSDYIGDVIRDGRHRTRQEWRDATRNVAAGFLMASLPVSFFVLAAFDVIERQAAFDAAEWSGVAVLGSYTVVANRSAGFSVARSLLVGLGFTILGAALVLLKVVL